MPTPIPPSYPPQVLTNGGPARQPSAPPIDPLTALKKAQGIGPDPIGPSQWGYGGVPMPGAGALQGLMESGSVDAGAAANSVRDFANGGDAVMERMYNEAAPVVQKMKDAGAFAGKRAIQAVRGLSQATPPAINELGASNPEFTPQGAEGLYNAVKGAAQRLATPLESVYNKILLQGGR